MPCERSYLPGPDETDLPFGVETGGAALLVLVRALLSSYRSYDWCLSTRPMTPEMWLDLEPIPHRALSMWVAGRAGPMMAPFLAALG